MQNNAKSLKPPPLYMLVVELVRSWSHLHVPVPVAISPSFMLLSHKNQPNVQVTLYIIHVHGFYRLVLPRCSMYHSFETSYTRSNTISPSIQSTSKMKPFHQLNCNQKHSDRMRKGFFYKSTWSAPGPNWIAIELVISSSAAFKHVHVAPWSQDIARIFQDLGLTVLVRKFPRWPPPWCSLARSVSCHLEDFGSSGCNHVELVPGPLNRSGEASSSVFCHSDDWSGQKNPMFGPFFMVNVGINLPYLPYIERFWDIFQVQILVAAIYQM